MSAYDAAVLADQPWAYWKLGRDHPYDDSGQNRGGSGGGGTLQWGQPALAPGLSNTSVLLTGANPWIGLNDPGAVFGSGRQFSVELWIVPTLMDQNSSGCYFISCWNATQSREFMLGFADNTSSALVLNSANNSSGAQFSAGFDAPYGTPAAPLGRPFHIVFTASEENTARFYVNGVGRSPTTWSNRRAADGSIRIGQPPDTFWGHTQGYYSNVALYLHMLSPGSVLRHYRLGMGRSARRGL